MTLPSSQRASSSLLLKAGAFLRTSTSEQRVPSLMPQVATIFTSACLGLEHRMVAGMTLM